MPGNVLGQKTASVSWDGFLSYDGVLYGLPAEPPVAGSVVQVRERRHAQRRGDHHVEGVEHALPFAPHRQLPVEHGHPLVRGDRRVALLRPYNLRFHLDDAGTIQLIFFNGRYANQYRDFMQGLGADAGEGWDRCISCSRRGRSPPMTSVERSANLAISRSH